MSYPNWGRARLVKIRKERKCRYCSGVIAPGEQTVKEAYFFSDEVVTHYSHVKCYIDDEAYNDEFIKTIEPELKNIITARGDGPFEIFAKLYPHEAYAYDPEAFWQYFHSRSPWASKADMLQCLQLSKEAEIENSEENNA